MSDIPPTVIITEHQIKALVIATDLLLGLSDAPEHKDVIETVTDLLHKLEFANDGKLRLSGRMRVIDIKKDDDES